MIASFHSVAGWMCFPALDRRGVRHYGAHTVAWRFTDDGAEAWTARIAAFKRIPETQDKAARDRVLKGAAMVLLNALPGLLEHYRIQPRELGLIAALSSSDTQHDLKKPLPRIAKWLAERIGAQWIGAAITKQPHQSLHTMSGGAGARDAEVQNKYVCDKISEVRNVIILDDIVTRGSTFSEIERAILASNPGIITLPIALGKAERQGWAASGGIKIDNEHVPANWAKLWDAQ